MRSRHLSYSLLLTLGLVGTLPSCSGGGSLQESADASALKGRTLIPMAPLASPPPPRSGQILAKMTHSLTRGMKKIAGPTTSKSQEVRQALRSTLCRSLLDVGGVPRSQMGPLLRDLTAPSSRACDNESCARIFGINDDQVNDFLDSSFEDVQRSPTLARPENAHQKEILLGSLAPTPPNRRTLGGTTPEIDAVLSSVRSQIEKVSPLLAYRVANTGCDYRAYLLAMELATTKIAPKALFANARTGFKLAPSGQIMWEYHVATSVILDEREFIIDPTFKSLGRASDVILDKNTWLGLLGAKKQGFWNPSHGEASIREHYFEGSFTLGEENARVRAMADAATLSENGKSAFRASQTATKMRSFDDLESFLMTDVNTACRSMTYLLNLENPASKAPQIAFVQHTMQLLEKLEKVGKIKRNAGFQCEIR